MMIKKILGIFLVVALSCGCYACDEEGNTELHLASEVGNIQNIMYPIKWTHEEHITKLYKEGIFSEETAAISLNMTVDEFKKLLQKNESIE